MRNTVEIFKNKNILFKELNRVVLRDFGIKKRYEVFEGVDIDNRYHLIFKVERKSRFLSKNADDLIYIYQEISNKKEHGFRSVYVLFLTPFCSKAKNILMSNGFKVLDASM